MARMQRMTRQREAVLLVLADASEFRSAQQVHLDLQQSGQDVSLATVYRNLQTLVEMGRLDLIRSETGESLYRLCATLGHHHHIVCLNCRRVEDVDLGAVEPALAAAAQEAGFELQTHELELFGLCGNCR